MTFNDQDIYEAVKSQLPKVAEYVSSHGGDIRLLGTKDGVAYIELTGACHGCSMSLMTTKMVVQKKLREFIHPELIITNVDGTPENKLPDTFYGQEIEEEFQKSKQEEGLLSKIKNIF